MSKQYGLIDPKSNKSMRPGLLKHAAFASDSDSDSQDPKKPVNLELGESQRRQARVAQEKALAEDPTIYQYDELYDDIESKRKEAKVDKTKEERKPKYISKLLETAEKRKKEQERRIERQVQKEREAEGEMYKNKESFVTSAYRAKLEEMKKAEELEKREEYLESIGDVTKQCDLDGFYRHIYSQKLGEIKVSKEDVKDENSGGDSDTKEREQTKEQTSRKEVPRNEALASSKSRQYRKRCSDDEENVEAEKNDSSKKVHLQSNLDADSDFSIDSNSSSSGENDDDSDKSAISSKEQMKKSRISDKSLEQNADTIELKKSEEEKEKLNTTDSNKNGELVEKNNIKKEEKKKEPKIDIWKKRTVGAVFDSALQRYYERKAARIGG
ncbi:nuclear speckle splicing regulatory protein 1 [Toxorhynchites rutilus septentrionalis]|uniref:nuclear speckle splicing regulatory protein 1 n=1 Tax=Toxorhynchites rutilus septentrionalis TaxID=329112 RepID=UPI002479A985|nr:nuclear speckle splicing regulatory protein 1 [Toxorhynchites rutilus septentrionalis]